MRVGPGWIIGKSASLGVVMLSVGLTGAAVAPRQAQNTPAGSAAPVVYLAQGWTAADREAFYTTGQGSHLMPYAWFKALRRLDIDAPFAGDQLERYGYLRNDEPYNTAKLPVGFVVDARGDPQQLGLSCAACHTGQLEVSKAGVTRSFRIDGAPADADFQLFLTDLSAAARATLSDEARFTRFTRDILGEHPTAADADGLQAKLAAWVAQFDEFMSASLPKAHPWGPGRLDAFGMIFNRVVARDLNRPDNFAVADAPVSYPFLWNAHRQDKIQWTGSVPNGLYIGGLARNTGEALGVFAEFKPYKLNDPSLLAPKIIRFNSNSVDFEHLEDLEEKLADLRPPPWPENLFPLRKNMKAQGRRLFAEHCAECHSDAPSAVVPGAWATTVAAVGTDPKTAIGAARVSRTGLYEGSLPPPPPPGRFGQDAPTTSMLKESVVGLLADHGLNPSADAENAVWRALRRDSFLGRNDGDLAATSAASLLQARAILEKTLAPMYAPTGTDKGAAYEGRSLHGVWATAPYLHNGSVPNLWELLKLPAERVNSFDVGGRRFDPVKVGFVTEGSPQTKGRFITGNEDGVGNGNGGHAYGTKLTEAQRWALIEFLKAY